MYLCPCWSACPGIPLLPPEPPETNTFLSKVKQIGSWILFVLSFPWYVLYVFTIPKCNTDETRKWYIVSFIMSIGNGQNKVKNRSNHVKIVVRLFFAVYLIIKSLDCWYNLCNDHRCGTCRMYISNWPLHNGSGYYRCWYFGPGCPFFDIGSEGWFW